jgi:hypothetical protein
MGKSKISKLALAIAAAGFLSGALPAQAYEMDAATVVQTIVTYATSERTELAIEMLERLRALGITQIVIDGEVITLAEIYAAVNDPDGLNSVLVLDRLLTLSTSATASSFVAGTIVVASVDSETVLVDVFPVGSVG